MSRYDSFYPSYVSVDEIRSRARRKIEKLRQTRPDLAPVIIEGRTLAKSWWGKSWNKNLERYADYSNRIERGRKYVRHLAVMHLEIEPGIVRSLVMGSASKPYEIEIKVDPLAGADWKRIRTLCKGKLDSLAALLAGKFPTEFRELFFQQNHGLFPSPADIHFSCSCPDWASMCKHVAATLYGIGARFDEDPELFFTLRNLEIKELISQTLDATSAALLQRADATAADDILDDQDLGGVFGIELDTAAPKAAATPKKKKKTAATSSPTIRGRGKTTGKTAKKKSKPKKVADSAKKSPSMPPSTPTEFRELVLKKIPGNSRGITVAELVKHLDCPEPKIRYALNVLRQAQKITAFRRTGRRAGKRGNRLRFKRC